LGLTKPSAYEPGLSRNYFATLSRRRKAMALTYTQTQIDNAVSYLMHGGPGGGELTPQQYGDLRYSFSAGNTQAASIYTAFILQLQLAIQQGHAGLANSRNICRDQFGDLNDAIGCYSWAKAGEGAAGTTVSRYGVTISG
jgi:hypothetical protein